MQPLPGYASSWFSSDASFLSGSLCVEKVLNIAQDHFIGLYNEVIRGIAPMGLRVVANPPEAYSGSWRMFLLSHTDAFAFVNSEGVHCVFCPPTVSALFRGSSTTSVVQPCLQAGG